MSAEDIGWIITILMAVKAAVFGEHIDREVVQPVFVLAEQVGDVVDREDGADGRHDQAAWLCGAKCSCQFLLADLAASARRKAQGTTPAVISPIALEAVRRIDALFDIERQINGQDAGQRRAVRQELSAPLVAELEAWMRQERARLSRHNDVAQAMEYMLKRWAVFARFLDDGRICLSNSAAERSLRGIALGRRAWLFAGADRGGERAAFMYSLIVTAKMNDIDPQAWLADVLRRIADHPASRLHELLPWHWEKPDTQAAAA